MTSFFNIFIHRPVGTTLLVIGLALAGLFSYFKIPVSALPPVDFPTVTINAELPGANPEIIAKTVGSSLERQLGKISQVKEMTSNSLQGSVSITLQFNLNRDINGATRDIQAAINTARANLPTALPSNPTFHKVNLSHSPILTIALTSKTLNKNQIYKVVENVIKQTLSQVKGVGKVSVFGSSTPAIRVELNPNALFHYGIGLEEVSSILETMNSNEPKGAYDVLDKRFQIYTNNQTRSIQQYRDTIIAYQNNSPLRLSDVAEITDSVEDLRNLALVNSKEAILVLVYNQTGSNIVNTVDHIMDVVPKIKSSLPASIDMTFLDDHTKNIRAALLHTKITLAVSIILVILVVFISLGDWRATLIPAVSVPVSIILTFGGMYILGFTIDTLSLMALTIATGFIVDDTIVVLENIARHIQHGIPRMQAAILGIREVAFTVVSMSLSLIAVFFPILLMPGITGRFFREFALVLSLAIVVSLIISLTVTPMMAARLLQPCYTRKEIIEDTKTRNTFQSCFQNMQLRIREFYINTLNIALDYPILVSIGLLITIILNFYLFLSIPKGFLPQQETGKLEGYVEADQNISFQSMKIKFKKLMKIVQSDSAVETVVGFCGGGDTTTGTMIISLKPMKKRKLSANQVIHRLQPKLSTVAGIQLLLHSIGDVHASGRASNAQYQYTLLGDSSIELYDWTKKLEKALRKSKMLTDISSDVHQGGIQANIQIDRNSAARYGITPYQIDEALYNAFGQHIVSTTFDGTNQYYTVMEIAPQYSKNPEILKRIFIKTRRRMNGNINFRTTMVPLSSFASFGIKKTPLSVFHQDSFISTTLSFNLCPHVTLSEAFRAIQKTMNEIRVPITIHGSILGDAELSEESESSMLILLLTTLITIYIVLGVLYESYLHPLTILSTLPSAGVGALLALILFNAELTIVALVGIILLIGIVKKNAIMMIDVSLEIARKRRVDARKAIFSASLLRFRPIVMTTVTAALGALPLVFGNSEGAELRRPLGISIIGGLIISQMLTLYTTPVVYLLLERFREKTNHHRST